MANEQVSKEKRFFKDAEPLSCGDVTAQPPAPALREVVQILEDGKELASVFHLRGAVIQALMKLHEQHPDAWPTATKAPECPNVGCTIAGPHVHASGGPQQSSGLGERDE